MTDGQFTLVNERKEQERPFDSREDAVEQRDKLIGLGMKPENLDIIPPGEDTAADGGPEIVDATPPVEGDEEFRPDDVTESSESDDSGAESLPDRDLTDDPIEWLQEGNSELTANIKGTTVITKKGFRVLQHKYDISTGSRVVVGPEENGHEFARVRAWAEMPDGRRAEAHASAHVDRGDDHFLLVSMADTRAKSRALSDVTGVGAVAIEEMAGVDPE